MTTLCNNKFIFIGDIIEFRRCNSAITTGIGKVDKFQMVMTKFPGVSKLLTMYN